MQSLLRQLPCCSVPRTLTSASASTSGSVVPSTSAGPKVQLQHSRRHHHQQQQQQHRTPSHIVRITGQREEYVLDGIPDPEDVWGEDADSEFIEVDTMPIWSPEQGPISQRIFRDAEDEQGTKAISIEDTGYWFADSGGVDLPRTTVLPAAQEVEVDTADEQLFCENVEDCPPRLKLEELEEGDELVGVVTDQWLWHGAFVDVLADYKGLIPIRQSQWPDVQYELLPGTEVVVRVHKLSEFPKYRFPIQLELLEPAELAPLIMKPDEYTVPANVGWCFDQGWDIQKVAAELGRTYEDTIALLEPDHDDWQDKQHYEFGFDASDGDPYPGDWITREIFEEPGMVEQVQEMAVSDSSALSGVPGGGEGSSWGI